MHIQNLAKQEGDSSTAKKASECELAFALRKISAILNV
jgi:hypothetical protein